MISVDDSRCSGNDSDAACCEAALNSTGECRALDSGPLTERHRLTACQFSLVPMAAPSTVPVLYLHHGFLPFLAD